MLHKDYQSQNGVVHSTSIAMYWLGEVLRSTRPSATHANVAQEYSQP